MGGYFQHNMDIPTNCFHVLFWLLHFHPAKHIHHTTAKETKSQHPKI